MQFIQTSLHIAGSLPESLTRKDQLPLFVDFTAKRFDEATADRFGQMGRMRYIPEQGGLGADLVHILPTRTTASGETPLEFSIWNRERGCENRHDTV